MSAEKKKKRTTTEQRLEAACLTLAEALATTLLGLGEVAPNSLLDALEGQLEDGPRFPEGVDNPRDAVLHFAATILEEVPGWRRGK